MSDDKANRYPVYVISKGRHQMPYTANFLKADSVDHHVVVEPQEADLYADAVGRDRVKVLPFSNLGQGSIPARNWVWQDSIERGYDRHWIFDDNIRDMKSRQMVNGHIKRIRESSLFALHHMERFADSYKNVGILGPNYKMFINDTMRVKPFRLNTRVYSCLLIKNDMEYRWRGRYNEDADLCLQVLSGGYCTVQVHRFLIEKIATMTMIGGNSDELYQSDGRLKMARSLERLWPGIVQTKRRFGRPQHVINWGKFRTPLIPK